MCGHVSRQLDGHPVRHWWRRALVKADHGTFSLGASLLLLSSTDSEQIKPSATHFYGRIIEP